MKRLKGQTALISFFLHVKMSEIILVSLTKGVNDMTIAQRIKEKIDHFKQGEIFFV